MLVVVASRHDEVARVFAERHATDGVALLTPEDLSRPGWSLSLGTSGWEPDGTAVVAGRLVRSVDIAGVLTRLPRVSAAELTRIVAADRRYVAAEMTAFLLAWLASLSCPVLNRPTPSCLAGPNWWPERWVHLATRLGVPTRAARCGSLTTPWDAGDDAEDGNPDPAAPPIASPLVTVTVVGRRCLGPAADRLAGAARRLAAAAGADLLAVHFDGAEPESRLVAADLWPDVSSPIVAEAVMAHLTGADR